VREDWNNKVVSCSFCNCRKARWNPVIERDSELGLEPETYRLELVRRSRLYIQSRLSIVSFPALPAAYHDALYAALKDL
jgi:hypothetical protein